MGLAEVQKTFDKQEKEIIAVLPDFKSIHRVISAAGRSESAGRQESARLTGIRLLVSFRVVQ
jgi:hypothetical protein